MPYYDNETMELVYTPDESEPFGCPVCTAGPEFGDCEILDSNFVRSYWKCPECGASGSAYDRLSFDGHRVGIASLSPEAQREYAAVKTMCINGPVRVGDLVLSTVDCGGFPCLPGRVTEIRLLGSDAHDTGNESDDIYVDFRGDYSGNRKREIMKAHGGVPFKQIRLDEIIMAPGFLININDINKRALDAVMDKEERAIRYAYHVVRNMLTSPESAA